MLRTATMMLSHLGEQDAADRISAALGNLAAEGINTIENGGSHGCKEVQASLITALS